MVVLPNLKGSLGDSIMENLEPFIALLIRGFVVLMLTNIVCFVIVLLYKFMKNDR